MYILSESVLYAYLVSERESQVVFLFICCVCSGLGQGAVGVCHGPEGSHWICAVSAVQ